MSRIRVGFLLLSALLLCALWPSSAQAGTLMKLNLDGSAGPSFAFESGEFSVIDDGDQDTLGSRNATIDATVGAGSLSAFGSSPNTSFTISGIQANSPSTTFSGSLMVQNFADGSFAVYGSDQSLLLSADLTLSAITGSLTPSDTEALFLAFGTITGGSLAQGFDPDSFGLKIKLPEVQGGFSVSPMPQVPAPPLHIGTLGEFTASAYSIEVLAEPIPEPASAAIALIGLALAASTLGRRR